jgi:hypothetical protein
VDLHHSSCTPPLNLEDLHCYFTGHGFAVKQLASNDSR